MAPSAAHSAVVRPFPHAGRRLSQTRPARVRLVLADDHQLFRAGLHALLDTEPDCLVVGEASDGRAALGLARELNPDILLLDYAMPLMTGMEVLREIGILGLSTKVILLTAAIEKSDMIEALRLGVRGLVTKDAACADLLSAIHAVASGQYWTRAETLSVIVREEPAPPLDAAGGGRSTFGLTSRELEVVAAVVEANANKEIAARLLISEKTVKHHLTNIFDKVGVSSRLELALFAVHHRLASKAPSH